MFLLFTIVPTEKIYVPCSLIFVPYSYFFNFCSYLATRKQFIEWKVVDLYGCVGDKGYPWAWGAKHEQILHWVCTDKSDAESDKMYSLPVSSQTKCTPWNFVFHMKHTYFYVDYLILK